MRSLRVSIFLLLALLGLFVVSLPTPAAAPARLRILFLGDNAGHRPSERYRQIVGVLRARGIDLTYTDKTTDLNPAVLNKYDGLLIYANHTKITKEQEKALLDYVASGKGFIPLHCASYCFLNSPDYIALVGAQFRSHGTGVFRTKVVEPTHPIMKGYSAFSSWDETYLHHKHNPKDRTVLEMRVDGDVKEPWTWVRTPGKARIFYTAWGHDARTWGHPGFQNLLERGIRWACNADLTSVPPHVEAPKMTTIAKDLPPFKYTPAKVPFYPPGGRGSKREPLNRMQLPLEPAESVKHMVTPTDFEIKLFADEKLLGGKPICMAWDERGRLWAAITRDYPNNLQPKGQGNDKIVIVEDTNDDGVGDKVTVFADKLSIPTSITFSKGGIIVHQAPDTLYLADTNGDGKADVRKVLFSGWGTQDTHAGPSNLHYGLDNWFYGMVGYSGYRGSINGERISFTMGFYRFKPDGSELEFLRNTNNNSWGVGFSEEGLLFGSTANGNPSVFLAIPNRYYEAVRGWSSTVLPTIAESTRMYPITEKVRQVDWHGQFTAGAGHALYTARTYPREYWNRTAFITEPTGHLVATFTLQRDGANFISRNSWNLLASDDEWCSPVMAEVGPDGNVWVLDWYNFIVQHNPTPVGFRNGKGNAYETPLRDTKHGRIYRLVHKKATRVPTPNLAKATPDELVKMLTNDNMLWRKHAQRLLVERGNKDVIPSLLKLVEDQKVDDIGLTPGAIHALWTIHGLGGLKDASTPGYKAAVSALKHPSAGVRRNAVMVLPPVAEAATQILTAGLLDDVDAQVKLAAMLSLQEKPTAETRAGKALAAMLLQEDLLGDRWLPDALTSAAATHAGAFLEAAAIIEKPLSSRAQQIISIVSRHWARGKPEAKDINKVFVAVAGSKGPAGEAILAGLAEGWVRGHTTKLAEQTELKMVESLTRLSPAGKATLIRLMKSIGSNSIQKHAATVVKSLKETIANEEKSEKDRLAAAQQVVELMPEDTDTVKQLIDLLTPRTSPTFAAGLFEAINNSTASGLAPALIERLNTMTPTSRVSALRTLLGRAKTTETLLDALEKGTVNSNDLPLDQKQMLAEYPLRAIRERARKLFAKGGGLPSADRQKVIEQLKPLLKKTGDVARGKAVFKAQCAKCHMHSGEGTQIGPDLTGMAVHPKEELLVHIMDPSRSVEGNFRLYTVTTGAGKILTGMLASETRTTIELVDPEAKRITVQRDNIETLSASNKSLMPEGFEKIIKEPELIDLLEFLTQKGKYVPIPLDKVATVVSTQGMFFAKDSTVERMVFPDWKPKTFDGVPFILVDPLGTKKNNVVLLYGPNGSTAPKMPKTVSLPCNTSAKSIHLLSGVSGWGYPYSRKGTVAMIVRLHYGDGTTEDHPLRNGEHFADYIRRVDVPDSKFAFNLRGKQIRYLAIQPKRSDMIKTIELVKGPDESAPIVMAVTVETK